MKCDGRIEFAMEAPTFVSSFTCSKVKGHDGQHGYEGFQRQRETGRQARYRLTWTGDAPMPASERRWGRAIEAEDAKEPIVKSKIQNLRAKGSALIVAALLWPGIGLAQNVTKTWTITSQDNADNEDGFRLYRRLASETVFKQVGENKAPNTSTFTDTVTAPAGSQVFYTQSAFNAAGESIQSAAVSGVMPAASTNPLTMTLNSAAVQPGASILVTVANAPGGVNAWVGKYKAGDAANAHFADWMYLNGSQTAPTTPVLNTTLKFAAPIATGSYEFRLFSANMSQAGAVVATTPFTVTGVVPTMALLTITKTGTGSGTVTSTGAGVPAVNCGADCTESLLVGSKVTMTATPAAGSTFTSWSASCPGGVATLSANVTCIAMFTAIVIPPPVGLNCSFPVPTKAGSFTMTCK